MKSTDDYRQKLVSELIAQSARIDVLVTQSRQAEADAKLTIDQELEALRAKQRETTKKLHELEGASNICLGEYRRRWLILCGFSIDLSGFKNLTGLGFTSFQQFHPYPCIGQIFRGISLLCQEIIVPISTKCRRDFLFT